ncbi:hypothetical protein NP233_g1701 [Leucocoprinus birnbaumii]|uniref:BRCT domain-containing protein n=1 Tax=Leucocoprinus birnbaumii TaxID=56174 RepID=A0AAD5VZN3_9AGAR|nr:hypothetical protein NP233_g1701 [Leucocoprinus birnbaumii]
MTTKPFPERRTRSQIKLSDDILKVPEHSPMKNARNATRKNSESPMEEVQDSEDELLLSPPKQPKPSGSKRSVSPPPKDEYSSGSKEDIHGRELKRMRREIEEEEIKNPAKARLTKPGHARTASEPNVGSSRLANRKRSGTTSLGNKPKSTSHVEPTPAAEAPTGVLGKARARSVPLFHSSSLSSLPSLDLRNPPLSPIRARSPSRSPDKTHGLRVYPSPSKPAVSEGHPPTEALSNEPSVPMEMDHDPISQPIVEADTVMEQAGEAAEAIPEVSISPSGHHDHEPLPEVAVQPPESPAPVLLNPPSHPPVTPMPSGLSVSSFMSPLTPLPETPLPPKAVDDGQEDRYTTKEGWGYEPTRSDHQKIGALAHTFQEPEAGSSHQPIPQPNFGEPKNTSNIPVPGTAPRSQIPRAPTTSLPPLPVLLKPDHTEKVQSPLKAPVKGPSTLSKPSLLVKTAGSSTPSQRPNAFTVLMRGANNQRAKQQQDKNQAKSVSMLPKAVVGVGSSNVKGKGKVEPAIKKPSLKDKMRGNQRKKAEAPTKFVPQVFDDDEEIEEQEPESLIPSSRISEPKEDLFVPPVMETEVSTGPTTPPLPVPTEPPVARPSMAEEPAPAAEENKASAQSRSPSPVSLITPLPESDSENSGSTTIKPVIVDPAPKPPLTQDDPIPQEKEPSPAPIESNASPRTVQEVEEVTSVDPAPESPVVQHVQLLEEPVVKQVEEPVVQQVEESAVQTELQEEQLHDGSSQGGNSKSIPKKRKQSGIPTSTRVTRSAFKPPPPPPPKPTRRPRSNSVAPRKTTSMSKSGPSVNPITTESGDSLPQGSPMQTSSPVRAFRTPGSSPAKISLAKTPSKYNFLEDGSPSPTKIARAMTMFGRIDRFATDDIGVNPGSSSLSTLSTALEKLKMPAPSRPNTSLGFNPDAGDDDDDSEFPAETMNKLAGLQRDDSLKRALTVGYGGSKKPASVGASSSQAGPSLSTKSKLVQKPMTMFFSKSSSSTSTSTASSSRSAKQNLLGSVRAPLMAPGLKGKGKGPFNNGGGPLFPNANTRLVQKASRKTTLPTVAASPVKGGGGKAFDDDPISSDIILDDSAPKNGGEGSSSMRENRESGDGDVIMGSSTKESGDEGQGLEVDKTEKFTDKGKEREKDKSKSKDSSRRASMALSQLSQSLSAAPAYGTSIKGIMGPPSTPRKIARSVSSTYPDTAVAVSDRATTGTEATDTTKSIRSSTSPDKGPGSGGKRFSARQAAKAALNAETKSPSTGVGPSGSAKKAATEKDKAATKKPESLGILKDCRIFVDVRTDDGEEAGSLFVEMLESLGAKIQNRVGQACTHVIFKNGLMSTITRYRLLRDPKPSVVGIAWVVECVEQRSHVEETPFLIDLSEMNATGTSKRRRSMLPKLISSTLVDSVETDVEPEDGGDADVSMDGSTSSLTMDDDLTPLERARRRRSMVFGPAP